MISGKGEAQARDSGTGWRITLRDSPLTLSLSASSPWRACNSECPHSQANADGERGRQNSARSVPHRPLSQGERDRVRGCDLRSWALPFALAASLALSAQPAAAYEAYVSNEKGNTVSVIDTDKLEVVKTIKVGQRPRGIAITKDGKSVIVAAGDSNTIQIIDTATKEITGTLPSGPDPEFFSFGPGGKRLYVANENDNTVTIIDMESRKQDGSIQVGVEPEGMTVSPDGKFVICTSETSNMAHFIDAKTHEIVANVLVGARPRFAVFKSDGSELWVSSEVGGTVSVIDPVKHEVKKKITFEVPGAPARGDSARGAQHHQGRQDRVRIAWPREPRRGRGRPDL